LADNSLPTTEAEVKRRVGGGVDPGVITLLTELFSIVEQMQVQGSNVLDDLPTSNPGEGKLWNDSGTVKVGTA
jgi:hypothetical protein